MALDQDDMVMTQQSTSGRFWREDMATLDAIISFDPHKAQHDANGNIARYNVVSQSNVWFLKKCGIYVCFARKPREMFI